VAERDPSLRPALAASAGLHLLVLAALLFSWRFAPLKVKPVNAVAVSVISEAPTPNVRAALQAPRQQTAAAPEPTPPRPEPPAPVEAPAPPAPTPPPPAPAPRPQPRPHPRPEPAPAPKPAPEPRPVPKPRPKPEPTPKPVPEPKPQPRPKPTPAPKPPPPKATPKPQPRLDLSDLARTQAHHDALDLSALSAAPRRRHASQSSQDLDLSALADAGGHRSAAARGPARAETDKSARPAVGAATRLDAASVSALKAKITRAWNPECGVKVDVRILLKADFSLAGTPTVLTHSTGADDGKVASARQHAIAAVEQAAPFTELPANAPRDIVLHFTPTDGCS
jgi:outer membrane biosynthesis protein TonB